MDKNEDLRGLEYVDPLYQAIVQKQALAIGYKSFRAKQAQVMELHPQILKEYNNRWFLIAFYKTNLLTLALDRMELCDHQALRSLPRAGRGTRRWGRIPHSGTAQL